MSEIVNQEAERNVIGAAILAKQGSPAHAVLFSLESSDFTDRRLQIISAAVRDMVIKNMPIDFATVCGELEARAQLASGVGGSSFVFGLLGEHVMPLSAEYYAEQVRMATRLRLLQGAADQTSQSCGAEDAGAHTDELMQAHRAALDAIPGPINTDDNDDTDQIGAIMAEQDKPTDWVIPGWLAREDRAVIVAGEGVAKTTLLRQFAVSCAGGLNPWNGHRVADGQRVLFIDAENSRNQSRRAYQWIAGRIVRPNIAEGWKSRLIHKTRNDGVDLPGRDAKWFMDVAARVCPDVLILGPAYKLMRGDPQKDRDVQDLLDVIDKVRVQQKCAVLIETHAPHGSREARHMRPYGSSVWLRWPELGIGYQRDTTEGIIQFPQPRQLESVDWRGQREDRDWPDYIGYGDTRKREMPWAPVRADWAPSVDMSYQIPDDERLSA